MLLPSRFMNITVRPTLTGLSVMSPVHLASILSQGGFFSVSWIFTVSLVVWRNGQSNIKQLFKATQTVDLIFKPEHLTPKSVAKVLPRQVTLPTPHTCLPHFFPSAPQLEDCPRRLASHRLFQRFHFWGSRMGEAQKAGANTKKEGSGESAAWIFYICPLIWIEILPIKFTYTINNTKWRVPLGS